MKKGKAQIAQQMSDIRMYRLSPCKAADIGTLLVIAYTVVIVMASIEQSVAFASCQHNPTNFIHRIYLIGNLFNKAVESACKTRFQDSLVRQKE